MVRPGQADNIPSLNVYVMLGVGWFRDLKTHGKDGFQQFS